jgi:hypothetical protein
MPNWVKNVISFDGASKEKIAEILETIRGEHGAIDFEKIIPMPDYIFRGDLGREEEELYGKNNWYAWSVENWGTKWNAFYSCAGDDSVTFETAWSAPFPVLKKLSEMFPGVTIVHSYADEDIGYNCGKGMFANGLYRRTSKFQIGGKTAIKFAKDMWGEY